MSTAANLLELLRINSDINHYTSQQMYYSNKMESNSKLLAKQVRYEEKWETAYDNCYGAEEGKEKRIGNTTYASGSESAAQAYADAKVSEYNEELKLELEDLDVEYDTMKTMLDTLLEELRAEKDSVKQNTSAEAQDTHLLGS